MLEERKFFETPEGVIATGSMGRIEASAITAKENSGLMKIEIKREAEGGRCFFQFIAVDPEMARLFASKILRVASEVENR